MNTRRRRRVAAKRACARALLIPLAPVLSGCGTIAGVALASTQLQGDPEMVEVVLSSVQEIQPGDQVNLQLEGTEFWIAFDEAMYDAEAQVLIAYRNDIRSEIDVASIRAVHAMRIFRGPAKAGRTAAPVIFGILTDVVLFLQMR